MDLQRSLIALVLWSLNYRDIGETSYIKNSLNCKVRANICLLYSLVTSR